MGSTIEMCYRRRSCYQRAGSIDGDAVAALAFDGCKGSGVASKVCGGLRVRAVANFFLQLIGCSGLMPVYEIAIIISCQLL